MTPAEELTLAAERIETSVLLVDELAEPLAAWLRVVAKVELTMQAAGVGNTSPHPHLMELAREVIRATGGTP